MVAVTTPSCHRGEKVKGRETMGLSWSFENKYAEHDTAKAYASRAQASFFSFLLLEWLVLMAVTFLP